MNISSYKIEIGKSIIFGGNGEFKIEVNNISFNKSMYYITLTIFSLDNGLWVKKEESILNFKYDEKQSFIDIENFNFQLRIYDIFITLDKISHIMIGLEINFNSNKCYLCYSTNKLIAYIYDNKHFCSKKCLYLNTNKRKFVDTEEKKNPIKKIKIDSNIKKLDIFLIGEDHGFKEDLLHNNLKDCLNNFSNEFNSIEFEGNIKRKPFLIFWEDLSKNNKEISINISEINGRTTKSWFLPAETDLISCFSFMDSAFISFIFRVNYDQNEIPSNYDFHIENLSIASMHGIDKINFKLYGYLSPLSYNLSWSYTDLLLSSLLQNNLSTEFLKIIIPDDKVIKEMINDLRELYIILVKQNRDFLIKKVEQKVRLLLKNNNMNQDEIYQEFFQNIFPKDDTILFTKEKHLELLKIIQNNLTFTNDEIRTKIEIFVVKYFLKISSYVNPDKVTFPYDLDLSYNIDINRIFQSEINLNYFSKLIYDIKFNIPIDIPTLLFLTYYNNLRNLNFTKRSLFVKLRNAIVAQTMIDICNISKIERCIIIHGGDHTNDLIKIFKKNSLTQKIDYSFYQYETTKMNNIIFFNSIDTIDYYDEMVTKIKKYIQRLYLYFMLESIDIWLYETEYNKSLAIIYPNIHSFKKLQYYSKLLNFFNKKFTDQSLFIKEYDLKIQNLFEMYIYLTISTNYPDYLKNFDKYLISSDNQSYKIKEFQNLNITRNNGDPFNLIILFKDNTENSYTNIYDFMYVILNDTMNIISIK